MQPKYVIVSKKNRTVRSFDNAGQVARFMWGRDFNDWGIYQRQDGLSCEIDAGEKVLEARERVCNNAAKESAIGVGNVPVFSNRAK